MKAASTECSCLAKNNKQASGLQQLRRYVRFCRSAAANTAVGPLAQQQRPRQSPNIDYRALLNRHKHGGCPALFLAPMENLADRPCRIALKEAIGGFDEACTEFIRVPRNSDSPANSIKGITASYDACELGEVPLGAQLMGSNIELLVKAAERLAHVKQAPRIDLNCGCPANVVTGGGAGSSLLRDPQQLYTVVHSMVQAVGSYVPISVKMRSGFDDTSLFYDNLLAVQEAGAAFVTIHPRTKQQSYNGRADWSLIAAAKQLLSIPVVGNGDIVSVSSALAMLQQTGCDGLMIGRGALQDPLLFHRLKQHFQPAACSSSGGSQAPGSCSSSAHQQHEQRQQQHGLSPVPWQHRSLVVLQQHNADAADMSPDGSRSDPCSSSHCSYNGVGLGRVVEATVVEDFLRRYASYGFDGGDSLAAQVGQSGRIGRLKKVMKYIFSTQPQLREACSQLLRVQPGAVTAEDLLERIVEQVHLHWQAGGLVEEVLVNHYTLRGDVSKADQTWQLPANVAAAVV